MCETLFYTGESVVVYSGFFVLNCIVSLALKGAYSITLFKKRWYWPKRFPGDIIYRNFSKNEVVDVDMLEAATEYINPSHIFCFK